MKNRMVALFVLLLSGLPLTSAWAQQTATAPVAEQGAEVPLLYFNREITVFRAPLLGVSPNDRARRAVTRIREQLEQPGEHKVTSRQEPFGVLVQIDGATTFLLTQDDADRTQQEPLERHAQRAASALVKVIADTRESRSLDAVFRALGLTLAATLAAALLLWLLALTRRGIERRLLVVTQRHAQRLQVGGVALLRRERVVTAVHLALTMAYWLLALVLSHQWLSFVLARYPYTRPWANLLDDFLVGLAGRIGHSIAEAVPGLLTALVIFAMARAVSQLADGFFERVRDGQIRLGWLDADVVVTSRRIAKAGVWLFALAMAYPYLPGAQTEAFKGLSVLVGLMVSLGASSLVGQAGSGLILTYGRVFRKGEFVRIGEHEGTVTELGIFATRIRTGLGEELTVSNSSILAATTKNYSRAVNGTGYVLDTTVTIGYDTPWRQVHAMLVEAALQTPGVLTDPPPQVFQTSLSDWYPEYRLVCQAVPSEPRPRAQILSALHANIQDVFNHYGVQIMSPQYLNDPAEPKLVPRSKWFTPPARE